MHIVKISNWIIKVNTDETTEFYTKDDYIDCSCDYCKNYLLNTSKRVLSLFLFLLLFELQETFFSVLFYVLLLSYLFRLL